MAIRKSPEAQLADVRKHVDRTIKSLLAELPQIVHEAGEMVLKESMPLVPEDTGALAKGAAYLPRQIGFPEGLVEHVGVFRQLPTLDHNFVRISRHK